MPSSRTLILKGILGVAGLGVSSTGGIGLGLGKTFTEGKKEQTSKDSSTKSGDAGDIVKIEDADLGFPEECEGSCSLTAEQLKKLKFEQKGDEEIKFEDLNDSDEFELTIEETEDETNYPKGKKYTLKPKTISGQVTIQNIKEGNIVLGKDQEVVIRETSSGGELEHLLEEVTELGIPKRCVGEQAAQPCDLTQLQLQKLKFETREKEKITVDGLTEGNIVTLKIEDKVDDRDNYPKGKKYTLTSTTGPVTIKGVKEEDITLEANQDVLIRETTSGGKLEHLLEEVDRLGIPKRCEADEVTGGTKKECDLKQKQLKDLKFEAKEGSSITVDGHDGNSKFILEIEDKSNELTNYPKGKKYSLRSTGTRATIKGVKDENIIVWENQSVVIIRETIGGGKLEKAPEEVDDLGIPKSCTPGKTCHLTEQQLEKLKFETKDNEKIKVEFLDKAKTVSLKVENKQNDTENYPKGKKYTLSTTKDGQVKIKGLNDGDITIGGKEGFVIREKETGGKLEKAPEEINKLGIPIRCKSGSACDLTKAQLEKLKFETNPGSSIAVIGLEDDGKVELKIETPGNVSDYPNGKKYILTSKTETTVTIQNVKDGNIEIGSKGVAIREKRAGDKLEKAPNEFNELGIPRRCKVEEVLKTSDTRSCEFTAEQLKKLKFGNFDGESDDVTVTGLKETEKIKLTISWSEDQNNYPDNKKYSFDNLSKNEDITITKVGQSDQTVTIAKQKESWFKNNGNKLEWVESKDKDQIAKENKLKEVKEILQKLGFEGSSTLSINFSGWDSNNPTRHDQTKVVEFSKANKNESDLKKIKFQALGGGATNVTDLSGWSIKVYLDWEQDTSRFPNNMKFSIENQGFSAGFDFWNGGKNVKIAKKTSGSMPTFKVVNYQLVKVS